MSDSSGGVVGLRVDVDTFRGTRDGVPCLLETLAQHRIEASFFFSVGPDNMGRHLWRLIRPAFLLKMLRSRAASLYGWDIVLRGTMWPGPRIGRRLGDVMRRADQAGHEIGLHAWDHHRWQAHLDRMPPREIREEIRRGMEEIAQVLGRPVTCSAAAGWVCNETVLLEKNAYPCVYHSDCRGTSVFYPMIQGERCAPQIPVTLPTYDELIGQNGIGDETYNGHLLSLIEPGRLNVLTIHAEVEGIARAALFRDFLRQARERKVKFLPLGQLLPPEDEIPPAGIRPGPLPGREGNVCWQSAAPITEAG